MGSGPSFAEASAGRQAKSTKRLFLRFQGKINHTGTQKLIILVCIFEPLINVFSYGEASSRHHGAVSRYPYGENLEGPGAEVFLQSTRVESRLQPLLSKPGAGHFRATGLRRV